MNLFQKYGYCHLPKGTPLFRMGKIIPDIGTFFALHPNWAINFKSYKDIIGIWELKADLNVLFMIKHLNHNGFPQTAIIDIYKSEIDSSTSFDDLDIKMRNNEARKNLIKELTQKGIDGWLSTQENKPPLEVFLLPQVIDKVQFKRNITREEYKGKNMLRNINIFPSKNFMDSSLRSIEPRMNYLMEINSNKEEWYSVLQKLFMDEKLTTSNLQ